jgi:hypothetical protein
MSADRDPVEEWRDVSRLAAVATGFRPRPRSAARWMARLSVGAVAAVVLVLVGGLALRDLPPPTGPGDPVGATAEDANFRLALTTPRAVYTPKDAIEPVASVTYLGPRATVTISHAMYPIGFQIKEVGGERVMGGAMAQPCLSTELAKGASAVLPFGKSGWFDDPQDGFDRAWYEDPVLRLPEGTWQIIAYFDASLGDCGGERHQLTVENVIQVVAGDATIQTPSANLDAPVVATAEDANFRLTFTTPRGIYGPNDAIEPVATVTYLGPRAMETMFHASYPIGFRIEEVGGERLMGGGMDLPCLATELAKGASAVVTFGKAGSPDDPKDGFGRAWYEDPVLRLPDGTWRIIAYLDVYIGDCGGERHHLTVENVVLVR